MTERPNDMNEYTHLLDFLPHRNPFLFLDRIVSFEASTLSAEGMKTYSFDDVLLSGIQAGRTPAIIPAGLLIESMAQLSAVLGHFVQQDRTKADPPGPAGPGYLVAINSFDYNHPVCMGEQTLIQARVTHSFGTMLRSSCMIHVADKICATAELSFQTELSIQGDGPD
ncbi:hypothetical protein JXQ70_00935 [bacterium]|nr:hypothetical protein [bacterium]